MAFFKLIRNAQLYDPEPRGVQDILIAGRAIARIAESLHLPDAYDVETVNAQGKPVIPGLIDLHVHVLGGGGEAGPTSHVPEVIPADLARSGITTVVGVLGTDNVARHPAVLLTKAQALDAEGITAFMYTGSYHLPSVTVTDCVKHDVALIREVLGVKVALSDHRSSQPTLNELARLSSEARVGGILGAKPGLVHCHIGEGRRGLSPLREVAEHTDIPLGQFLPTHVNRTPTLLTDAIDYANAGGYIDITVPGSSPSWPNGLGSTVERLKAGHVNFYQVTFSSDGNGSMPRFDEGGELTEFAQGEVDALANALKSLVTSGILSFGDALGLMTENPAQRLGIHGRKGRVQEGMDADVVMLSDDLDIERVYARGRLLSHA